MDTKGLQGIQYRPLSGEQVKTIHEASLTILERTGMTFESGLDDTLEMLQKAGAKVDSATARIRFPRDLVMNEVVKAPERVILYSQDGKNDLDLAEHRVHMGTGGAAIRILDLETSKARPTTLNDLYQLGRLVDKLDNVHFFLRPCIPTDIPQAEYDVNVFYTCLKATAKHVQAGVNDVEGFYKVLDLASVIAGGREKVRERPFISIITSYAISPLKLCTQSTTIMREAARNHIPVVLSCAPMAGSTSPLTMAGTLAQLHAEQLAGITICQLEPRLPPALWRNSGDGQSADDGLSGRRRGMRDDECRGPPIITSRKGTELQLVGSHRFEGSGRPGRMGEGIDDAARGDGRFELRASRGRYAGIDAGRVL